MGLADEMPKSRVKAITSKFPGDCTSANAEVQRQEKSGELPPQTGASRPVEFGRPLVEDGKFKAPVQKAPKKPEPDMDDLQVDSDGEER